MQTIDTDPKQRDDGGVRGLSELIILQEIMSRLKHLGNLDSLPKPCDYFDIIGGTGTGGYVTKHHYKVSYRVNQ
ncbi:hypothetical protein C0993_007064 [Termitomyces sp. T159_Od127]|nr:hypothetical protein C0993_007064 [Termitomyces sp. T159_Od127]